MAKSPDLTGQKFGMLYVESKAESRKDNSSMWNCVCDCGNTCVAALLDLRNGKKTDCGCISSYRRSNHALIDLTGKRFGKLEVLSKEPVQKDGRTRWLCKCDCGSTYVATSYALRNSKTKSCGCGRRKDIAGLRFGKLTALERSERYVVLNNRKKFLWRCVCDCGEVVYRLPEKLQENVHHACDKCAGQFAVSAMLENAGFVEGTQLTKIASSKPGVHSKSGVKGVFFNNRSQKWRAMLRFKGVNHYLGEYKDINEAIRARKLGEEKYFVPFLKEHNYYN